MSAVYCATCKEFMIEVGNVIEAIPETDKQTAWIEYECPRCKTRVKVDEYAVKER